MTFTASVKKNDPDDELEAPEPFPTIKAALEWIAAQRPYGFLNGWVSDSVDSKRADKITPEEIVTNQLNHERNPHG